MKANENIERVRQLFAQMEQADKEIRAIIAVESQKAPSFSSAFFKELQRLLKTTSISNLMVLMLSIHARPSIKK